jgi:hypothetical protein
MARKVRVGHISTLSWEERATLWRDRERFLLLDVRALRKQLGDERRLRIDAEAKVQTLSAELTRARQQITELLTTHRTPEPADELSASARSLPSFVKPNVAKKPRKKPGRKMGHIAALRPMPSKIDQVIEVPLARNDRNRELCPRCRCALMNLRSHDRIIEDLTPSNVEVIQFKTRSGHCVNCDRRVESRAPQQPPAPISDLPHGQIGINALSLGLMLRIRHRLPFRQITHVFQKMAGLKLCAGALVKQMKRIAGWLEAEYQKLILKMRASGQIHADETGWRIDGKNAWTWVFTQPLLTLFVTDPSRSGKVVKDILGEAFGGTVVCDFYGAYDGLNCPKQRCLTHLLREIRDEGEKDGSFATEKWVMKLKRWCQDGIAHKKKWKDLPDAEYELKASRIEDRLDELIKKEPGHIEAKRLHKRLIKHRADLTRFLWEQALEPTNNPAERALRPMVIARKITGGSRTPAHAEAWAQLSSLLATQEQNGKNVLEETKKLLREYWAEGR